VGPMR